MIVYHGSDHIIETPVYHGSKRTNDYGYGFYTTESKELAKGMAGTALPAAMSWIWKGFVY